MLDRLCGNIWVELWPGVNLKGSCQLFSNEYSLEEPFEEITIVDYSPQNQRPWRGTSPFVVELKRDRPIDKIIFKFDGGMNYYCEDAWTGIHFKVKDLFLED